MNASIETISIVGLLWAFVPTAIALGLLYGWSMSMRSALHAVSRMLIQLLLIGYVLMFIFETTYAGVIVGVLGIMLLAASWIALRPLKQKALKHYKNALMAIFLGGMLALTVVTQGVLDLDPWYLPRYVVPLAGMIFASSMNAVSLAAERFEAELAQARIYTEARNAAFSASLIPIINSLFAVGLVTLPGMMTGQILSGVSPLIAAKYQIVIMCSVFGASGISAAVYLVLLKEHS